MSDPPPAAANGCTMSSNSPQAPPTSNPQPILPESTPDTTQPPAPKSYYGIPSTTENLSKKAQKKLKRQLEWESTREDRKRRRKEKRQEIKARKRDERHTAIAEAKAAGIDPRTVLPRLPRRKPRGKCVPVGIIIDCSFDGYMQDKEITSLSAQIQRAYSESRGASYRAHLWISGWGGRLRERFEGGMRNTHSFWKGIQFEEGDFLKVAKGAKALLTGDKRGEEIEVLKPKEGQPAVWREQVEGAPVPEEEEVKEKDIIYLSSESPYILERLEPGTCYVIGGLVDKNREKGLCYGIARKRGVRTAKLPIGEYMELHSRKVLATNHVVEIMLRWLETGDWGKAFMAAIPRRKGGKLKEAAPGSTEAAALEDEDGEELDADEEIARAMKESESDSDEEDEEDGDREEPPTQ